MPVTDMVRVLPRCERDKGFVKTLAVYAACQTPEASHTHSPTLAVNGYVEYRSLDVSEGQTWTHTPAG